MFTYPHNWLKYYLLIVMVCLLQACADNHKKTETAAPISDDGKHINLRTLVVEHSPLLQGQVVSINENMKMSDLPELDAAFFKPLEELKLFSLEEGEFKTYLYYYGYLNLPHNYIGAVFGYSFTIDETDEKLILAILDSNGKMLSGMIAANIFDPNECRTYRTTQIKDTTFTSTYLERCAVLHDTDAGSMFVDSVTTVYILNERGKLELKTSDTVSRMEE